MISTNSFSSSAREFCFIYKKEFNKYYISSLILTALCFLFGPFIWIMRLVGDNHESYNIEFRLAYILFSIAALYLAALIYACLQFRYMHNKASIDLYHSLPVRRIPLLLGKYVSGLTLILIPFTVNFSLLGFLFLCTKNWPIQNGVQFSEILDFLPEFLVALICSYSFYMMVSVLTGGLLDMLVFTGVFTGVWPLGYICVSSFAQKLLFGYSSYRYGVFPDQSEFVITMFSPLIKLFYLPWNSFFEGVWWIALTVIITVGTLYLYKYRRSEAVGKSFAFKKPMIIFKILTTIITGLFISYIFGDMFSGEQSVIVGVVIGLLAGYFLIELVTSRGLKGFIKNIWQAGVALLACICIFTSLFTGFFGYSSRVPEIGNIESIAFRFYDLEQSYYYNQSLPEFKSEEAIKAIKELHETIIAKKPKAFEETQSYMGDGMFGTSINIAYRLKNKTFIRRGYDSFFEAKEKDCLLKLASLKEYKDIKYPILKLRVEEINEIRISTYDREASYDDVNFSGMKETVIYGNDVAEFIEAYRRDVEATDEAEMLNNPPGEFASCTVALKNQNFDINNREKMQMVEYIYISIKSNFVNCINFSESFDSM